MKHLLIVILLLSLNSELKGNQFTYISPGFLIGFNFGGGVVYGPKISIGSVNDIGFRNITVGCAFGKGVDKSDLIVEAQYGEYHEPLLYGGGLGFSIPLVKQETSSFAFRMSLLTGYVLFLNNTISISNSIDDQASLEFVAPFPLSKNAVLNGE